MVNFSPSQQLVGLRIRGLAAGSLGATGQLLVLGGQQPLDENSFHEPLKVCASTSLCAAHGWRSATPRAALTSASRPHRHHHLPCPQVATRTEAISGVAEQFELALPAWSVSVLKLRIVPPAAKK